MQDFSSVNIKNMIIHNVGNKVKGENDMSSADVIISIKTGQVITTVILVITTIIMLGVAVYIVRKIIINKEIM